MNGHVLCPSKPAESREEPLGLVVVAHFCDLTLMPQSTDESMTVLQQVGFRSDQFPHKCRQLNIF